MECKPPSYVISLPINYEKMFVQTIAEQSFWIPGIKPITFDTQAYSANHNVIVLIIYCTFCSLVCSVFLCSIQTPFSFFQTIWTVNWGEIMPLLPVYIRLTLKWVRPKVKINRKTRENLMATCIILSGKVSEVVKLC